MLQTQIERPVFVCGTGRSGTTVTQRAIGLDDNFAVFGELEARFMVSYGGLLDLFRALGQDFGLQRSAESIRNFRNLMSRLQVGGMFGALGLDTHLPEGHYSATVDQLIEDLGGDSPCFFTDLELLDRFREFLDALLFPMLGANLRWADGTPHSLMQARFLLRLLPGAQFLHVTRDPRAVVMSLMRQTWAPDDVAGCCDWLENVYGRLLAEAQHLDGYTDRYLHMRFEDIVTDQERSVARIARFINTTGLTFEGVRLDADHVNKWVQEIKDEDSTYITGRFGSVYELFGYEPKLEWWRDRPTTSAV